MPDCFRNARFQRYKLFEVSKTPRQSETDHGRLRCGSGESELKFNLGQGFEFKTTLKLVFNRKFFYLVQKKINSFFLPPATGTHRGTAVGIWSSLAQYIMCHADTFPESQRSVCESGFVCSIHSEGTGSCLRNFSLKQDRLWCCPA